MTKVTKATPVEHEEDKKARLDGEAYAAAHVAEFCKDHSRDLRLLIETYADADARELLEQLREMFWASTWKPSTK